jgi:hypothetical protein
MAVMEVRARVGWQAYSPVSSSTALAWLLLPLLLPLLPPLPREEQVRVLGSGAKRPREGLMHARRTRSEALLLGLRLFYSVLRLFLEPSICVSFWSHAALGDRGGAMRALRVC